VSLVSWEPSDVPWEEHCRHSPLCSLVEGSHTPNVPLSITLGTASPRPFCPSTFSSSALIGMDGLLSRARKPSEARNPSPLVATSSGDVVGTFVNRNAVGIVTLWAIKWTAFRLGTIFLYSDNLDFSGTPATCRASVKLTPDKSVNLIAVRNPDDVQVSKSGNPLTGASQSEYRVVAMSFVRQTAVEETRLTSEDLDASKSITLMLAISLHAWAGENLPENLEGFTILVAVTFPLAPAFINSPLTSLRSAILLAPSDSNFLPITSFTPTTPTSSHSLLLISYDHNQGHNGNDSTHLKLFNIPRHSDVSFFESSLIHIPKSSKDLIFTLGSFDYNGNEIIVGICTGGSAFLFSIPSLHPPTLKHIYTFRSSDMAPFNDFAFCSETNELCLSTVTGLYFWNSSLLVNIGESESSSSTATLGPPSFFNLSRLIQLTNGDHIPMSIACPRGLKAIPSSDHFQKWQFLKSYESECVPSFVFEAKLSRPWNIRELHVEIELDESFKLLAERDWAFQVECVDLRNQCKVIFSPLLFGSMLDKVGKKSGISRKGIIFLRNVRCQSFRAVWQYQGRGNKSIDLSTSSPASSNVSTDITLSTASSSSTGMTTETASSTAQFKFISFSTIGTPFHNKSEEDLRLALTSPELKSPFHKDLFDCLTNSKEIVILREKAFQLLFGVFPSQLENAESRLSLLDCLRVEDLMNSCFLHGSRSLSKSCTIFLSQLAMLTSDSLDSDFSPSLEEIRLKILFACETLLPSLVFPFARISSSTYEEFFSLMSRTCRQLIFSSPPSLKISSQFFRIVSLCYSQVSSLTTQMSKIPLPYSSILASNGLSISSMATTVFDYSLPSLPPHPILSFECQSSSRGVRIEDETYTSDTYPYHLPPCAFSSRKHQLIYLQTLHGTRWVVLDLGKTGLLTHIHLPVHPKVEQINVETWQVAENTDLTRVVIAHDLSKDALSISCSQICRYIRISIFGASEQIETCASIDISSAFYGICPYINVDQSDVSGIQIGIDSLLNLYEDELRDEERLKKEAVESSRLRLETILSALSSYTSDLHSAHNEDFYEDYEDDTSQVAADPNIMDCYGSFCSSQAEYSLSQKKCSKLRRLLLDYSSILLRHLAESEAEEFTAVDASANKGADTFPLKSLKDLIAKFKFEEERESSASAQRSEYSRLSFLLSSLISCLSQLNTAAAVALGSSDFDQRIDVEIINSFLSSFFISSGNVLFNALHYRRDRKVCLENLGASLCLALCCAIPSPCEMNPQSRFQLFEFALSIGEKDGDPLWKRISVAPIHSVFLSFRKCIRLTMIRRPDVIFEVYCTLSSWLSRYGESPLMSEGLWNHVLLIREVLRNFQSEKETLPFLREFDKSRIETFHSSFKDLVSLASSSKLCSINPSFFSLCIDSLILTYTLFQNVIPKSLFPADILRPFIISTLTSCNPIVRADAMNFLSQLILSNESNNFLVTDTPLKIVLELLSESMMGTLPNSLLPMNCSVFFYLNAAIVLLDLKADTCELCCSLQMMLEAPNLMELLVSYCGNPKLSSSFRIYSVRLLTFAISESSPESFKLFYEHSAEKIPFLLERIWVEGLGGRHTLLHEYFLRFLKIFLNSLKALQQNVLFNLLTLIGDVLPCASTSEGILELWIDVAATFLEYVCEDDLEFVKKLFYLVSKFLKEDVSNHFSVEKRSSQLWTILVNQFLSTIRAILAVDKDISPIFPLVSGYLCEWAVYLSNHWDSRSLCIDIYEVFRLICFASFSSERSLFKKERERERLQVFVKISMDSLSSYPRHVEPLLSFLSCVVRFVRDRDLLSVKEIFEILVEFKVIDYVATILSNSFKEKAVLFKSVACEISSKGSFVGTQLAIYTESVLHGKSTSSSGRDALALPLSFASNACDVLTFDVSFSSSILLSGVNLKLAPDSKPPSFIALSGSPSQISAWIDLAHWVDTEHHDDKEIYIPLDGQKTDVNENDGVGGRIAIRRIRFRVGAPHEIFKERKQIRCVSLSESNVLLAPAAPTIFPFSHYAHNLVPQMASPMSNTFPFDSKPKVTIKKVTADPPPPQIEVAFHRISFISQKVSPPLSSNSREGEFSRDTLFPLFACALLSPLCLSSPSLCAAELLKSFPGSSSDLVRCVHKLYTEMAIRNHPSTYSLFDPRPTFNMTQQYLQTPEWVISHESIRQILGVLFLSLNGLLSASSSVLSHCHPQIFCDSPSPIYVASELLAVNVSREKFNTNFSLFLACHSTSNVFAVASEVYSILTRNCLTSSWRDPLLPSSSSPALPNNAISSISRQFLPSSCHLLSALNYLFHRDAQQTSWRACLPFAPPSLKAFSPTSLKQSVPSFSSVVPKGLFEAMVSDLLLLSSSDSLHSSEKELNSLLMSHIISLCRIWEKASSLLFSTSFGLLHIQPPTPLTPLDPRLRPLSCLFDVLSLSCVVNDDSRQAAAVAEEVLSFAYVQLCKCLLSGIEWVSSLRFVSSLASAMKSLSRLPSVCEWFTLSPLNLTDDSSPVSSRIHFLFRLCASFFHSKSSRSEWDDSGVVQLLLDLFSSCLSSQHKRLHEISHRFVLLELRSFSAEFDSTLDSGTESKAAGRSLYPRKEEMSYFLQRTLKEIFFRDEMITVALHTLPHKIPEYCEEALKVGDTSIEIVSNPSEEFASRGKWFQDSLTQRSPLSLFPSSSLLASSPPLFSSMLRDALSAMLNGGESVIKWKRIWARSPSASNSSIESFRSACFCKVPLLILLKEESGDVLGALSFGGVNPKGKAENDRRCFLFNLTRAHFFYPITTEYVGVEWTDTTHALTWGSGHDLYVSLDPSRHCHSYLQSYCCSQNPSARLTSSPSFYPLEIEVFTIDTTHQTSFQIWKESTISCLRESDVFDFPISTSLSDIAKDFLGDGANVSFYHPLLLSRSHSLSHNHSIPLPLGSQPSFWLAPIPLSVSLFVLRARLQAQATRRGIALQDALMDLIFIVRPSQSVDDMPMQWNPPSSFWSSAFSSSCPSPSLSSSSVVSSGLGISPNPKDDSGIVMGERHKDTDGEEIRSDQMKRTKEGGEGGGEGEEGVECGDATSRLIGRRVQACLSSHLHTPSPSFSFISPSSFSSRADKQTSLTSSSPLPSSWSSSFPQLRWEFAAKGGVTLLVSIATQRHTRLLLRRFEMHNGVDVSVGEFFLFLRELKDFLALPHFPLYFVNNVEGVAVLFRALQLPLPRKFAFGFSENGSSLSSESLLSLPSFSPPAFHGDGPATSLFSPLSPLQQALYEQQHSKILIDTLRKMWKAEAVTYRAVLDGELLGRILFFLARKCKVRPRNVDEELAIAYSISSLLPRDSQSLSHLSRSSILFPSLLLFDINGPSGSQDSEDATQEGKGGIYWERGTGFGYGDTAADWDEEESYVKFVRTEKDIKILLRLVLLFISTYDAAVKLKGHELKKQMKALPITSVTRGAAGAVVRTRSGRTGTPELGGLEGNAAREGVSEIGNDANGLRHSVRSGHAESPKQEKAKGKFTIPPNADETAESQGFLL
jgi:hypothetical protein